MRPHGGDPAAGDFADFLGARWPAMVHTLVLLGVPSGVAESVVADALGVCRRSWPRLRALSDTDVAAYRELLDALAARRRTSWWEGASTECVLPAEVEAELDRLTAGERLSLVLEHVAGLDAQQVAEVLDQPAGAPVAGRLGELVHRCANELPVAPVPEARTLVPGSRPGGARRRVTLLAVVVLMGLMGVLVWSGLRDDAPTPTGLGPAPYAPSARTAEVAWYANGELHLRDVVLRLPALRHLVEVGGGAVYGDQAGRVVLVCTDGTRALLGTKDPEMPIAVSPAAGWVAWVDQAGTSPQLVVYDVAARAVLASLALPVRQRQDARPIAIDGGRVYYADAAGEHVWDPESAAGSPVGTVEEEKLLDVSSGSRVVQYLVNAVRTAVPFSTRAIVEPGVGAELSDDGNLVLTRTPEDGSGFGRVRIFDNRSGAPVATGLDDEAEVAIAARLSGPGDPEDPRSAVTYIVARLQDHPDDVRAGTFVGPLELRRCSLGTGRCTTLERFRDAGSTPLLAR